MNNEVIYDEMKRITEYNLPSPLYRYKVDIIANGKYIPALRFQKLTIIADYEGDNFADKMSLRFSIDPLSYRQEVFPYRKNLRVRITRSQLDSAGDTGVTGEEEFWINKALLVDSPDPMLMNTSMESNNTDAEEISNAIDIRMELTELALETVRKAYASGVPRNSTPTQILKCFMGYKLDKSVSQSDLTDPSYEGIRGVEVSPPVNDSPIPHLLIPSNGRVLIPDLPNYLQNEKMGLYQFGCGTHLQDGRWYVFPLRNVKKRAGNGKRLVIVNISEQEMPTIENSYREEQDNLFVISTGQLNLKDNADIEQLNQGSAITYTLASSTLDKMAEVSKNKLTARGDSTVKTIGFHERETGVNNFVYTDEGMTENPYPYLSKLSKGLGRYITLEWHNSNHRLLHPGMSVSLLYMEQGIVKELVGTLSGVRTDILTPTEMITDNDYRSMSVLKLFLSNETE